MNPKNSIGDDMGWNLEEINTFPTTNPVASELFMSSPFHFERRKKSSTTCYPDFTCLHKVSESIDLFRFVLR